MKHILLLFAFGFICLNSFSQTTCTTPVSNTFFQREYGTISTTTNSTSKLSYAITLANNNCLSASQVKQVALLLIADQDKLDFCKAAYKNTVDKENFYDVYDAFAYFSTVFRLHDYVAAQKGQTTTTTVVTTNINTFDYPVYSYPDFNGYFGVTGCNYPIDETAFFSTYNSYRTSKLSENGKLLSMKDYVNVNCLSTAQIMKLTSILSMESFRLDLLKAAYLRAYDRGNFASANQLLTSSTYKVDFNNYINGNSTTITTTTTVPNTTCIVSNTDMMDIKNSINNSSFDNTKMTVGKQAIAAKKCLTVSQIKEILGLYSFESSKLEVAKYAYDYCVDKSNYYQVNDVFSFTSSKDDLTKYIAGK